MSKQFIEIILLISTFACSQEIGKPYIIKTMVNDTIAIDTCYPRTKNDISSYVDSKIDQIREIYNKRILNGFDGKGKIDIKFVISSNGSVIDQLIISNETNDTLLGISLLEEIKQWKFIETRCPGTEQTVVYPFVFTPSEVDLPPDGPYKVYYDNGKLKEEGNVKNGKQIGEWISYHENGIKQTLIHYVSGKIDGKSYLWNEKGNTLGISTYNNGLPHGEWITYHENGKKSILAHWENGKKDSLWISWYKNGKKQTYGYYDHDNRIGIWRTWHENGTISSTNVYKDGVLQDTSKFYYKNGKLYQIVVYKDCNKNGTFSQWNEFGNLMFECNYKDDKEDGPYLAYYTDGSKAASGNYKNGKKSGLFKEWYKDGSLISEKLFRNDSLINTGQNKKK